MQINTGVAAHKFIKPFKIIQEHLALVRDFIKQQLQSCRATDGLESLVEHVTARWGKMLRPGLVLLSAASIGKVTDKHIKIAAIFELIHNATLLHDDVVDQADRRRGRYTVNNLYGNESAVLLGDFLLSQVFKMCAELDGSTSKIIASAAASTCEGELRQHLQKNNWSLGESDYIQIISAKTAAIFSSCCSLGGLLAGADDGRAEALGQFGLNTGIAFQITDDVLDIIGDENKTGKAQGSDFDRAIPTLPLIYLLKNLDKKRKAELTDTLERPDKTIGGWEQLKRVISDSGGLSYAKSQAKDFAERATASLKPLPESPAKTALADTASFIISRAG